jgi:site-specific recombinase XerD
MTIDTMLKSLKTKVHNEYLSDSTKRTYFTHIKKLILHFHEKDKISNLNSLSSVKVNNYVKNMINSDLAPSSKRAMLRSIILLCKLLKNDIVIKSYTLPDEKHDEIPEIYTKKQILSYCDKIQDKKQQLIFLLLFSTGLTMRQVVKLKVKDVDLSKNRITLNDNKDGFHNIYPIVLKNDIKALVKKRDGEDPLFMSLRNKSYHPRTIQHHFQKAQTDHNLKYSINIYSIKASAIVYLIKEGYSEDFLYKKFGLTQSPVIKKLIKIYTKHKNIDII